MNPQRTPQSRYLRFSLEHASGLPDGPAVKPRERVALAGFPQPWVASFVAFSHPILPYAGQTSWEREDSRAWFLVLPTSPLHGFLTLRSHVGLPAMSLTGSVPRTPALNLTLSELLKQPHNSLDLQSQFQDRETAQKVTSGASTSRGGVSESLYPKSKLVKGRPSMPLWLSCAGGPG